jgi:hypothetical protein
MRTYEGMGGMNLRFKVLAVTLLTGGMVLATGAVAAANPRGGAGSTAASSVKPASGSPKVKGYRNKFTKNANGWCVGIGFAPCDGDPGDSGTIVRTKTLTAVGGYAPGIAAESGSWYATVDGATDGSSVCSTYPAQDESCDGPYTNWGNPNGDYYTFPKKGFTTSLDIYLDTSWAEAYQGNEFEWDTAVNQSNGQFGQDFIFTARTGADGFTIGTGNNTQSSVPTPSATISTSGWYRFVYNFVKDPSTGDVVAVLSIIDEATDMQVTGAGWVIPVIFNADPVLPTGMGGPVYGWFPKRVSSPLPTAAR